MSTPATLRPVLTVDRREPWLGLASYREDDSALFFGRESEAAELLRLIRREVLTVLFGPSGTGKTSLLNAGLSPRLRKAGFLPVYIRLDHSGDHPRYIDQVIDLVRQAADNQDLEEQALAPPISQDLETLWEYTHRVVLWDERNNPITIVLVFDQFEEIFAPERNRATVDSFMSDLADLVQNYIPGNVHSGNNDALIAIPFQHDEPHCKVVLSLREDFVWRLDTLANTMPSVMHNRYPIIRMNREQALLAVREPGRGIVDNAVAQQIVSFVAAGKPDVDPALLSIMCRELNARRIKDEKDSITAELVEQSQRDILNDFYERCFERVSKTARIFVEDRLLTTSGFRGTAPVEDAMGAGVRDHDINTLIDRRLLRREEHLGIPHLELTHDVLTGVVQKSGGERRRREELHRVWRLVAIMGAAALTCTVLVLVVWLSYTKAETARADLEKQKGETLKAKADLQTANTNLQISNTELQTTNTKLERALKTAHENAALAQRNERESKARELATYSLESLPEDLERSILLGMHAVDATLRFRQPVVDAAEDTLHRAIGASHLRLTLRGHSSSVKAVAFSPNDKLLATASRDGTGKVWDAFSGRELLTLRGHSADVNAVVFGPDGMRVATASNDGTAKLWDGATGQQLLTVGHSSWVRGVAFSRDGRKLATASQDMTAKLWDAATGHELFSLRHTGPVVYVVFSPDGQRLATVSDGRAKLWDADTGRELQALRGSPGSIAGVAFSPDGQRLATTEYSGTPKVWDLESGEQLQSFADQLGGDAIVFSPDGKRLATSGRDGTAKVWDASSGQELLTLRGHSRIILYLAFSSDGKRLATASEDQTVKVWDAIGEQELLTWRGYTDVYGMALSPDGRRLATALKEGTARVWDADSGRELLTLRGHSSYVSCVAYTADGKRMATGSGDRTAKVWDAATGRELLTLRGHTDRILDVAFSPDARRVATGSGDGTVRVWDSASGQQRFHCENRSEQSSR